MECTKPKSVFEIRNSKGVIIKRTDGVWIGTDGIAITNPDVIAELEDVYQADYPVLLKAYATL